MQTVQDSKRGSCSADAPALAKGLSGFTPDTPEGKKPQGVGFIQHVDTSCLHALDAASIQVHVRLLVRGSGSQWQRVFACLKGSEPEVLRRP